MLAGLTIAEIPKPIQPRLAREIAEFTLTELSRSDDYQDEELALEMHYMQEGVTVAGFTEGATIIASGIMVPDEVSKAAEIRAVVTAEQYRKLGVGREVLAILEERGRELGMETAEIFALEGSERFYWRQGYRTQDGQNYLKKL